MSPGEIEGTLKSVMTDSLGLSLHDDGEINITVRKKNADGIQTITASIINDETKYYIRMIVDHALRMVSIDSYQIVDSQVLFID